MDSTDITFTVFRGSKSGSIIQSETTRPPLAGDQVLISITASGLCGGDLGFKGNDARISLSLVTPQALTTFLDGPRS